MKKLKPFFIGALSAGWLLPLYCAFEAYRSFLLTELLPTIRGQPPLVSFGEMGACTIWLATAMWWLGIVIVYWVKKILDTCERQQKQYQKYLDSLGK